MSDTSERLAALHERIAAATQRAGRAPGSVRLIGVSKTHAPETVAEIVAAGLNEFGENRVQEAETKIAALEQARPNMVWHLIGSLQSNKARKAAALFDMVQSVDSVRLAEALSRHAGEVRAAPLPVLLQVNVSGEASKSGFALADWEQQPALLDAWCAEVATLLALPHIAVHGLMTVAPWSADAGDATATFRSTRVLRDTLAQRFPQARWEQLSMGMTGDFEVAIAEGATMVRVGRALFSERPAPTARE